MGGGGVIGDGSLHREGRVLTLHTQGYSEIENNLLSRELNEKFLFNTRVLKHKNNANKIHDIIKENIISSIIYKLPRKLKRSVVEDIV